jgi:hypothetical protein
MSLYLFYAGAAILVLGIVLPGWDTATLPKRTVKRRVYWTATVVAIPVLFAAGWPDPQSSVAFVAMALVLMGGWAYTRTPNVKIGGRIWALDPANREPDPAAPDR